MRLNLTTLGLLALATSAAADELTVVERYNWNGATHDRSIAAWTSGYGHYDFNGNGGCGGRNAVPSMREYCLDWGAGRGHFFFDNQPKRCLSKWKEQSMPTGLVQTDVYIWRWKEVPCSW